MSGQVLLGIDTSMGTSVALSFDEHTYECNSLDERGHTEVIGGLLEQVFAEAGVSPEAVTGVVVGVGPGPFTGLRVGIAAAKAFALARSVPLLPLSGHEAVADDHMIDDVEAPPVPVRVLQDARRRELFVTEYFGNDDFGLPLRIAEPRLLARSDYVEEPRDVWPDAISASGLLWLAEVRLRSGRDFESEQALYLRRPDVYPPSAPKRAGGPKGRIASEGPTGAATAAAHGAQRGVST